MANNTRNSRAMIDRNIYGALLLRTFHFNFLPRQLWTNVTDFNKGEVYVLRTLGTVAIQDGGEEHAPEYTPIESGQINMIIDNYLKDAYYVTDELREDGSMVEALVAARASESAYAFNEVIESRFLRRAVDAMPNPDPYAIDGEAHKIVVDDTSGDAILNILQQMQLSFDRAGVPAGGRVVIVDPVIAQRINSMVTITSNMTSGWVTNILSGGFEQDHRYITNLFGWDIITSNRLPRGTYSDGTTTVDDGVPMVFMSVLNDQTKPMMMAWRRYPKTEFERNKDLNRDEWVTSCRFGIGFKRSDSLGVGIVPAGGFQLRPVSSAVNARVVNAAEFPGGTQAPASGSIAPASAGFSQSDLQAAVASAVQTTLLASGIIVPQSAVTSQEQTKEEPKEEAQAETKAKETKAKG